MRIDTSAFQIGEKRLFGVEFDVSAEACEHDFGFYFVGLAVKNVNEKLEQKRAHVQTRRIGKVRIQIGQSARCSQPIAHLIIEFLVVSIATNSC